MIVKICGITNLEDALVAVAAGAAALGFNFYPQSPRCITAGTAAAIASALPLGVWKVGVFVEERPERVSETVQAAGLDVVQMHGNGKLPPEERVWKAVRVGPQFDPGELDNWDAEAFLLDTASETLHGGTGKSFNWAAARNTRHKIVLAGGLDAGNVRDAIQAAKPWGVDSCSRLELSPGRKDHRKMARFIEAALF